MSDSETTPPKKGRSKLLLFGVPAAVLLIGGAGVGFWYVKDVRAAAATPAKAPVEKEPTGLLAFEPFTVNLADPGGRRYLRVSLRLVLPDPEAAKKATEEEIVMTRVRSTLLEVLSAQTATQLGTPEGREALKHMIAETADHAGHLDVRDVLFQEFVVQ
jgi:flagellar FliL protein